MPVSGYKSGDNTEDDYQKPSTTTTTRWKPYCCCCCCYCCWCCWCCCCAAEKAATRRGTWGYCYFRARQISRHHDCRVAALLRSLYVRSLAPLPTVPLLSLSLLSFPRDAPFFSLLRLILPHEPTANRFCADDAWHRPKASATCDR